MFFREIYLFQNRNRKGSCFAGAGAGLTEHIDAGQSAGNQSGLNGRGLRVFRGSQSIEHRARK